jgi:hypothetical protein
VEEYTLNGLFFAKKHDSRITSRNVSIANDDFDLPLDKL